MKQLEVQIMGQSYMLVCPENGEQRLREAVARIDAAMCKIRDAGKVKARDRIAVLAALNLAFELLEPEPPAPTPPPVETPAPEAIPEAPEAPEAAAGLPPGMPDETGREAPHPQLTALLQRLDTALGASSRPH